MVEFLDPLTNKTISYHIDSKLKSEWDKLREGGLKKIFEDRVYLVDGREGSGKSLFTFQQAKYLNPYFDVKNICFTPEDFIEQMRTAEKGSIIVFDEAFRGLSSKGSRSSVNRQIVEALMEVRQRSLVIFIVLPSIFLLEVYAAVFRSQALFHVYKTKKTEKNTNDRAFKIYNYAKKTQLYLRGRQKYMSYHFPKIKRAKGRWIPYKPSNAELAWMPYETFDIESYLKKKEDSFRKHKKEEEGEGKFQKQRDLIIYRLYKEVIKSQRKLSLWLEEAGVGMDKSMIGIIVGKVGKTRQMASGAQRNYNELMNKGIEEEKNEELEEEKEELDVEEED